MANTEACVARDKGIATASNHADRIDPTWRERAYNALVEHAKTHPTFTIEQLRAAAGPTLEDPPSLRAWGGVAQRAQKSGILEHHGWVPSENPACHTGEVRVWRSRICAGRPFILRHELTASELDALAENFQPGPLMVVHNPPAFAVEHVRALVEAARSVDAFFLSRTVRHSVATPRLEALRSALAPFGGAA